MWRAVITVVIRVNTVEFKYDMTSYKLLAINLNYYFYRLNIQAVSCMSDIHVKDDNNPFIPVQYYGPRENINS